MTISPPNSPHPPIPPRYRVESFISLRTKFVLFLGLIIAVTCSSLSWYFIANKRTAVSEQLINLGSVLVKNLAHNARYGIIVEDASILEQFIAGVMEVEQVVYVVITRSDGEVLAAHSKGKLTGADASTRTVARPLYPDPAVLESALKTADHRPSVTRLHISDPDSFPIPLTDLTLPFLQTARGAESFYDFVLPVMRRRPSSQLDALALQAEESLLASKELPLPIVLGTVQIGLTTAPAQQVLLNILGTVVAVTLAIIVAGIFGAMFLTGRIITPLRNLAAGARRVSAGDLSTFVPPTTQDEVGQLTALFNQMTQSLQERNQAISTNLFVIRKQVAQLTTLNQASAAITSTLDLDKLLTVVLQLLTENLGFAHMVLMLYDSNRGIAYVAQVAGLPPELQQAARQIEIPIRETNTIGTELLVQGKPVIVSDVMQVADRIFPPALAVFQQIGVTSFVGAPLRSQQRILGYLGGDRGPQPCTQEDLDLLMTVASHVAVAIDNARTYSELELLTHSLERRVDERTRELQGANRQLQEHDRRRSKFVSVASHELRTPMTSIKGFVENMLDGLTGQLSDRQSHYLNRVKHNVERLTRIINQLLDWSRLDVGRIELSIEPVQLADFVRGIIESLQTLAEEKSIVLHVESADNLPPVRADRDKLEQILWNLIGNAIKFTPSQGRVTVECAKDAGGFVRVCVADTGCGIAPHQLSRVFDEFSKVESSLPGSQGAQLGLFISKSLVTLHGGKIWAESELGQGSKFFFTLPTEGSRDHVEPGS